MPLVRVTMIKGKSPDYIKKMSDSIYEALVEAYVQQKEETFQIIEQLEPSDLIYARHFGIKGSRSGDFVIINIESDARRRGEKEAFLARLSDKLAASPGIARDDVFVRLSMAAALEDWSLGSGIAVSKSYAPPARRQVNSRLSRYGGCHEEVEVYRVTDRCDLEGRRSRSRTQRVDQQAWDRPCDLLQLASEVRRGERLGDREHGVAKFFQVAASLPERQRTGAAESEPLENRRGASAGPRTLRARGTARGPIGIDSGIARRRRDRDLYLGDMKHEDHRTHRRRSNRKPDRATCDGTRLQGCDRQLAWAGNPVCARCRTRTECARGGGCRRRKSWGHRCGHRPAQELPAGPGRAPGGQGRDRHEQLLPTTRRPHPRARQRVDDHLGAPAGAPADLEGRQGIQPHLRGAAHDRRKADGHEQPPCACHSWRRSGCEGHGHGAARPVRLRHGGRRPPEGRVAYPA